MVASDNDDDGFITLPPGISADSATHRRPRPERTVRPEHDEIVFVPMVPGAPPVVPAEPQPTEPMPSIPTFTPPPAAATPAPPAAPPASPATAAPAWAAAPSAAPAPAAMEDDAGETRVSVSRHAASGWRLGIPGLGTPVIVDAPLYLGRNPLASLPGAKALALDDEAKSLSKTHALLEVVAGALYVTDLNSTNGVWVVPVDQDAIEAVPGERTIVPAGADLELGDVVIQVEHG